MKEFEKTDRFFFIIGWILLGLGIAAGLFLRSGKLDFLHRYELCGFHRVTGWYCPGCGITRACFALSEGRILRSLYYNITPLLLGLIAAIYQVWMCCDQLIGRRHENEVRAQKSRLFHRRLEIALMTAVALILLQWLLKMILLIGFGVDMLA